MKNLLAVVLAGACVQPAVACDLCSVYAATEAQGGSGKGFTSWPASFFIQWPRPGTGIASLRQTLASPTLEMPYAFASVVIGVDHTSLYSSSRFQS